MIMLKPPFRAEDMQGFYKKVLRGHYPKVANSYSSELANVVRSLIQVSPHQRPSCERILGMASVVKWGTRLWEEDNIDDFESFLLRTIKVPKNLGYLTERLPQANYKRNFNEKKSLTVEAISGKGMKRNRSDDQMQRLKEE